MILKKIFLGAIVILSLTTLLFALPSDIKILTKDEISGLSNQQLLDYYIEALVELETARTFHNRAGFQPRDIQGFKDLVRYRLQLLFELHKRKIRVPKTD